MRTKILQTAASRTWAVIFEAGDELASGLERFASENALSSSSFTGIGALQDVILGYFDWERKEYTRIPLREQVEVLSLLEALVPRVHRKKTGQVLDDIWTTLWWWLAARIVAMLLVGVLISAGLWALEIPSLCHSDY